MPANEIEVINAALYKLGKRRITDLTDETKEARVASDTFSDIRLAVLSEHKWDFAVVRVEIAEDTLTTPAWGYSHVYPTPANCLRVLDINDQQIDSPASPDRSLWTVEGTDILTRDIADTLGIVYVRDEPAVTTWTPTFVEALATRCAFEWSETLGASSTMKEQFASEYSSKLSSAASIDAQQGVPDDIMPYGWVQGRQG